jgi:hypothetical protein
VGLVHATGRHSGGFLGPCLPLHVLAGVYWSEQAQKWMAHVYVNNRVTYLASFDSR